MIVRSNEKLAELIEQDFGFKKELIEDIREYGIGIVRFTVRGIKYRGWRFQSGVLPQISVVVEGYTSEHTWQGCPVTNEFYDTYVKGRKIKIFRCIGEERTNTDTGIIVGDEEAAIAYINNQLQPEDYFYDVDMED